MRKIKQICVLVMMCFMAAGCRNTESDSAAYVEEIPIETQNESMQVQKAPEVNEGNTIMEEKEPYEEIEVELNGNRGVINVGTTGAPYTELLTQARIQLAKDGWDLQIKFYEDYEKLSEDVLNGTLDAHLFAHQTYIDSYNDVNKTELVPVAPVCYEVYGIYSGLNEDLTKISGAVVGIPQDATRKARVLLYMNDLEWIILKENVGMTAIIDDIVENKMNLQFVEYTQETLAQVMSECDYCIIGGDMAIMEGLDTEEGAIRTETMNDTSALLYTTLLFTTKERYQIISFKLLQKRSLQMKQRNMQ